MRRARLVKEPDIRRRIEASIVTRQRAIIIDLYNISQLPTRVPTLHCPSREGEIGLLLLLLAIVRVRQPQA